MAQYGRIINVEIKAHYEDFDAARERLLESGARAEGTDTQVDTYFDAPEGRLKLREGDIERSLIYYERADQEGPKSSHVSLMKLETREKCRSLRGILADALGVLVVVEKCREIYYLDNVKIHLDRVAGLGTFVEIEAASPQDSATLDELNTQCRDVMTLLRVSEAKLVAHSYSDMLLDGQG